MLNDFLFARSNPLRCEIHIILGQNALKDRQVSRFLALQPVVFELLDAVELGRGASELRTLAQLALWSTSREQARARVA